MSSKWAFGLLLLLIVDIEANSISFPTDVPQTSSEDGREPNMISFPEETPQTLSTEESVQVSGVNDNMTILFPTDSTTPTTVVDSESAPRVEECPNGFSKLAKFCVDVVTAPKRWKRAKRVCKKRNAQLAKFPHTRRFTKDLLEFLQNRNYDGFTFWTRRPKSFRKKNIQLQNMRDSETTSVKGGKEKRRECFYLDVNLEYVHSTDCNTRSAFICQARMKQRNKLKTL